jgi:hypothetical protein
VEKEGSLSSGMDVEQSRVRRRRLLQIGRRARENEREMGGRRLSAAWGREMGERERAPNMAVGSTGRRTWPTTASGRRACATRRCTNDMRGQVASWPVGSARGTRERGEQGSTTMGH